jgi:23S rRNA pseudouridine1911/1915/1917 synthase
VPPSPVVLVAGPGDARRLDTFLAGAGAGLSRAAAQRLIRSGAVTINGEVAARPSSAINPGDRIEVASTAVDSPPAGRDVPPDVRVVYEDDWLLIADKPAGMSVHPGAGNQGATLAGALVRMRPEIAGVGPDPERPGIVHRLDKDTSGLIAVARTADAYDRLTEAVRGRTIIRRYTALVWGRVMPEGGIIDAPVGRHPGRRQRQAITTAGRPARTGYRVLRHLPTTSLVLCTLQTGRMHQIRVHMAGIGFPVVGDPTYGRPGFGLKRQFLHATYLAFDHPFTGERVEAESPLPADLESALREAERMA